VTDDAPDRAGVEVGEALAPARTRAPDVMMLGVMRSPFETGLWRPVDSLYVETFWLPVLGPTAVLLARRVTLLLGEFAWRRFDPNVLAALLGVNTRTLRMACRRLALYSLARPWTDWDDALLVLSVWPRLYPRRVERLPELLQAAHAGWVDP